MSNGDNPVVPGQTPGTTPPFLPSQQGGGQVDDQTKKMLGMLLQQAAQKKAAGQPRPSAVPGRQEPFQPPSYMSGGPNPHAWGAQRFMYGVQSMLKNAVAKQKEEQINKAMADWEYAQLALNEYYSAQSSGNQEALAQAQKKLDVVFGDPKKLKNMAKALNQDWLNPEKTTVHGEALKRVAAETQQKDQSKQNARTGITNMFKSLLQKRQGTQYTPGEKQGIEKEVIEKAPTTTGALDPQMMKGVLDVEKAAREAREQYATQVSPDGTVWYYNKTNPKDAHIMRDADTGEAVKGKTGPKEGQLVMANGVPIGVFHGGQPTLPGDPGFTAHDKTMFDSATEGLKEKQFLRLPPEIAAQVGDPPDPKQFSKGRSDPGYKTALAAYGKKAESIKEQEAAATGVSRAIAFNEYRVVQTMDADGNVYFDYAKNAMGQSPAGEGIKLKPREQQMTDIQVASKQMRDAINGLDKPFSAEQIAKLHYAMETDDPSLANTELAALASQNLTDKQQDFVIWTRQLNERAMSLRNVAGMGTGAQDLRTAIRAMIPGIRSGSKEMMNKQLDAFDNQVSILRKGIAHPGKTGPPPKGATGDKPPTGVMIPEGWKWSQQDGVWGITDGRQFRPYTGEAKAKP